MARHDILKNPLKLETSRQVFKQLDSYLIGLSNKNEALNDDLLEYAGALQKFRNKRTGELKKTALRTNKARAEFNEIIKNLKSTPELSKKFRQSELKRKRAEMNKGLLTVSTDTGAKRDINSAIKAHDIFKANIFDGLLDGSEIYNLVLEMSEDDTISADDVIDVFETIRGRYEMRTPDGSMDEMIKDDRFKFLESVFNKLDKLNDGRAATDEEFLQIIQEALEGLKEMGNERQQEFFEYVKDIKKRY